ncbi:hypothetical protein CTZ27_07150 [Streptomyces griseocarneus]|nr:hypothetical protein CTZ27_07150 [Streptomyces griseocarneus]
MNPRRTARTTLLVGGVLLAGVALTGCGSANADDADPEHKAFALSGQELTVDSDNSELELVPGEGKDVKVTRQFSGWTVGGSSSASWEMEGHTLKLRQHCSGIVKQCESKHRIEVPRGVKVTVQDDNGGIQASGFDQDLKVRSSNGPIRVKDSSGALDLSSSNGSVTATGNSSPRVKAHSSNGNVAVALTKVPDSVEATNNNGNVKIELPGTPRVPYAVDAHSDNGTAKVDVPTDNTSKHSVTGRSNNGNVRVVTAG